MNDSLSILTATLPVFLAILAGVILRHRGLITTEADTSLLRLVVRFLYPCLIFSSVFGNRAWDNPLAISLAPLFGFGLTSLGLLLCYGAARVLKLPKVPAQTFAFTSGIFNYGYFPIPIIGALFGTETLAILFAFNMGVEAALWIPGILTLTGEFQGKKVLKTLINPPVIALLSASAGSLLGLQHHTPAFFTSFLSQMGMAAIPLGLILIGATLRDECRWGEIPLNQKVLAGSLTMRLGILPIIFLAVATLVPSELQPVILVQAAMPSAILPIVLSKHYQASVSTALQVVLATTLAGLISIPLWIRAGAGFLQLPLP